jgi:hypothetical protein
LALKHKHTLTQLKKRHDDEKTRLEQLYLKEQAGRRDDQVRAAVQLECHLIVLTGWVWGL